MNKDKTEKTNSEKVKKSLNFYREPSKSLKIECHKLKKKKCNKECNSMIV